jgi:hypothetical protein
MFCSGCGHELQAGEARCPQCGWTAPYYTAPPFTAPPLPFPSFEVELARYAGKVRVLGILWLIWAGLFLLMGFAELHLAHAFLSGNYGPFAENRHFFPDWFLAAVIPFIWGTIILRAVLSAIAGWGLLERTQWGRILAIIAAVISLLKFPFGTALAVATLIILLGYRNSTLYDSL